MYIGNHAVLYQDDILNKTEWVAAGLRAGGCDGIEVGQRFFGIDKRQELKEILDKNGLNLSAFHVSALADEIFDQPETVMERFNQAAEFLQAFPFKNIMFTSLPMEDLSTLPSEWDKRLHDEVCLKEWAVRLEEMAETLEERGVTLHFHNHSWEFADDGKWFNAVAEYAPHVHLGLDIGWVYVAGFDPADIILKYGKRINYVHLRDLNLANVDPSLPFSAVHQTIFEDIGKGNAPLKEILMLLDDCMDKNGWATIEYEFGDRSFSRYSAATTYIRNLLNESKGRE